MSDYDDRRLAKVVARVDDDTLTKRLNRLWWIEEAARFFLAEEERWFRTTDARPFDAEASARASRVKHKALDELEAALKSDPATEGESCVK